MRDISAQAVHSRRPLTTAQQIVLSVYWLATSAHWSAILITLLPIQAESIGGAEFKGRTLGSILLFGALVSMVVAPFFGAWSDSVRTRWGRRKPFLVVGTICNVAGLLVMANIHAGPGALPIYIATFMWLQLFNNLATAPYTALLPDITPPEQRGSASGWMGLMSMLGTFVGGITGLLLPAIGGVPGAYLMLAAIMLVAMLITVFFVHEPPAPPAAPFQWGAALRGMLAPFRSRDFGWVFFTRFLVILGTFTVQEFIQFFMQDVVGGGSAQHTYTFFGIALANTAAAATSFFIIALLVGAVGSSLVAGKLSDRYGRKIMVYISGGLQALVVLVFALSGRFEVVVLLGVVFGVGYGAYRSVDWALITDVLPNKEEYAKDMGMWHIADTLPQILATPIAGALLDEFQRVGRSNGMPTLGYNVIFAMAFFYFLLGTALVRNVRGAR